MVTFQLKCDEFFGDTEDEGSLSNYVGGPKTIFTGKKGHTGGEKEGVGA